MPPKEQGEGEKIKSTTFDRSSLDGRLLIADSYADQQGRLSFLYLCEVLHLKCCITRIRKK